MHEPTIAVRTLQPRAQLLRRRALRQGWLLVLAGLIIPFLALWGSVRGLAIRDAEPVWGTVLAVTGLLVFVVRFGLYVL